MKILKQLRKPSARPRRRRGATLVEALAGTVLLGSLLVGILMAHASMQRQLGRANKRIDACRVADELLNGWWGDKDKLPRSGSGEAEGVHRWTWLTKTVENDDAGAMGGEVVALEIFDPKGVDDGPAVRVEIILREPPR